MCSIHIYKCYVHGHPLPSRVANPLQIRNKTCLYYIQSFIIYTYEETLSLSSFFYKYFYLLKFRLAHFAKFMLLDNPWANFRYIILHPLYIFSLIITFCPSSPINNAFYLGTAMRLLHILFFTLLSFSFDINPHADTETLARKNRLGWFRVDPIMQQLNVITILLNSRNKLFNKSFDMGRVNCKLLSYQFSAYFIIS